jgi:predicted phosphodiesterase
MKIHVLSDLHLEFAPFEAPATDADVVVLAGDTHPGTRGLAWAREAFPTQPVIYVCGNHEFYGQSIPKHQNRLRDLARGTNVHLLDNESLSIAGVRFLGCTLWTDFALFGDPRIAGYEATQRMTDFRRIRLDPRYQRLRSVDACALHHQSRRWLQAELSAQVAGPTVVVTHHAPSPRSLPDENREQLLSAAYASDLDEFVATSRASIWIHGHMHEACTYRLGATRVVCNPRGYPDEVNHGFDAGLLVEVCGEA